MLGTYATDCSRMDFSPRTPMATSFDSLHLYVSIRNRSKLTHRILSSHYGKLAFAGRGVIRHHNQHYQTGRIGTLGIVIEAV
ncbi:unnamed protein product [Cylicostephanus goldi]|uniref:Uncharacterized protein n=1 Tax=Cylicostephanus goldi TaxID=71465 RepID=A0A3P6V4A5_CYLGO|nr:unnamed protein product [Cylicostephanus goldi]